MKRKIVICDDEQKILENLSGKIKEIQPGKWDISVVDSLEKLKEYLTDNEPDLLLLDIRLEDGNGIDLACEIQGKHPYIPIIFITGYNEYAQEIFRVKPIYMLTKPFNDEKIRDALLRAVEFMEKCKSGHIVLKTKGKIYNVDSRDICYAESIKRKMIIVTLHETYEVYMNMEEMLKMLPDNFVCCHKSYVVNMNYIQTLSNTEIILTTGVSIPVSRSKNKEVKGEFMTYIVR